MGDVFISYARATEGAARSVAEALATQGISVWWDDQLPAHRVYADVITERLGAAKVVLVLWSEDATRSQWVRAEADFAREAGTLVQVTLDGTLPPLPFNQVQCANLAGWAGDPAAAGWRKVAAGIAVLVGTAPGRDDRAIPTRVPVPPRATLLAVLPFDNLSSDSEMEFFSDGVSEDILARISRGSKLQVIGRTSSFQFRGADKPKAAAALRASHVLDGSIRRAGSKVRIAAHLTETANHTTVWSGRYDRDLEDIFAVQDEISEAISTELQSTFFADPAAKIDPAAYDLYLQARAIFLQDLTWANKSECRRLLAEVVALAPDFAPGWGLLAVCTAGSAGEAMARRGLAIDPKNALSMTAMAVGKPPFSAHREKYQWSSRAYALDPGDQMVAGIQNVILMSLGYMAESRELSEKRFEREPLSPIIASDLAMAYRASGLPEKAVNQAERALLDFPDAAYAKFIRGVIAVYDGDLQTLARIAALPTADGSPNPLLPLQMFMEALTSMPDEMRRVTVEQFLGRNAPRSSIVDIGLAAAVGEVELAMDHLLATLREGRPLEFAFENEGRSVIPAATCSGLFMPNCEELRGDPRFAEVCVRLGLYESWHETGQWPDCAEDVASIYDLRGRCEQLAGSVDRYDPPHARQ